MPGNCYTYSSEVTARLHGNKSEVIFLVAPDQECFVFIVEDTSSARPESTCVGSLFKTISVRTSAYRKSDDENPKTNLQESIALLEEEVVIDEFLLHFLGHSSQRVEATLELSGQSGQGRGNLLLHFLVLSLGQAWVERVSLHGSSASDPGGNNEFTLRVEVSESIDITPVLRGMLVSLLEAAMVVFDYWVEEIGEDGVRFGIRGINADAGIGVLNT